MKKVNLLSKAEMKKVMGGMEEAKCYVYTIQTLDDGTTRRYVTGTVDNATDAKYYATKYAVETGSRFGYDCDFDGVRSDLFVS
jgi:hypothetical protein